MNVNVITAMRTYEEYQLILKLWEQGENKSEIAHMTGIPRATVRDCINRFGSMQYLEANKSQATKTNPNSVLLRITDPLNVEVQTAYIYLLGLYLGDGAISKMHRVHRLRVALDKRYTQIIESCVTAIQIILPDNQVGIVDAPGCVHVSCYHKFWPEIFPQDGDGRKHERRIVLEDWQQDIVDRYPLELFRGLYHSDGSRDKNVVNGKSYPRYSFRNFSADIRQIYCNICDNLNLNWTMATNGTSVNISRRKDVEYLDRVIGPKC